MKKSVWLYGLLAAALVITTAGLGRADVKPGDVITEANMAEAQEYLMPTTEWMLRHGYELKVKEYEKIEQACFVK